MKHGTVRNAADRKPAIGNYLGALKNWGEIQSDYECIFCIVDLHGSPFTRTERAALQIIESPRYTCRRIDPRVERDVQSAVPAHAELAWMLTASRRSDGWSA